MNQLLEFAQQNPTTAISIAAAFFTSLTTVLVTLINYWISKNNLEKQLAAQYAVTVNKEWIAELRVCITYMINRGVILAGKFDPLNSDIIPEKELEEFSINGVKIQLLLNDNNPLERDLREKIVLFSNTIVNHSKLNPNNIGIRQRTEEVMQSAHRLFDSIRTAKV